MSIESGFGDRFVFTLLTDDPVRASWAAAAGVERIGPDLESVGKPARQAGLGTRISAHSRACLPLVADAISERAKLFARINPIHDGSPAEIEAVLAAGIEVLMLPYFHSTSEVERFVALVDGRALCVPLAETAAAAILIDDIAALQGVDEIHIGLTDMMISTRVDGRFRLMGGWFIEALAARVRMAGRPLGLAGIAKLDQAALPIPPDLVLAQFVRLGATGALITRTFSDGIETAASFASEIAKVRCALNRWASADPAEIAAAGASLRQAVDAEVRAHGKAP